MRKKSKSVDRDNIYNAVKSSLTESSSSEEQSHAKDPDLLDDLMQQTEEANVRADPVAEQAGIVGINIQTLPLALGLPEDQIVSAMLAQNLTEEC